MLCKKCNKELQEDWKLCPWCGKKQVTERHTRTRGNGEGCVYKEGNRYRATVVLCYYLDDEGQKHRKTRSKTFLTHKEAVAALPTLMKMPDRKQLEKQQLTMKQLYDKWLPTHEAGKSTIDCYKAAFKYFEPLWYSRIQDIDIDDLQECLDECGKGKRTQQNMKAVCGLIYKYGIPRQMIPQNLNLATFLKVRGEDAIQRESFTDQQIRAIEDQIGRTKGADQVYCLIYLGLRPSEYLALRPADYDIKRQCIVGGAKTAAGKGRTVTVSPKIQPYLTDMRRLSNEKLICDLAGKGYTLQYWTENIFYKVLDAAGIDNPSEEIGDGMRRHKYTPHSCRHTFSTLMKRVAGADKDKLELIGHTSPEMLRYYQDVTLEDLRKITDNL